SGDGWLWLHFSLTDKLARTYISALAQLPEPARALLVGPDERLGIESSGDAIYGVLADFEREFDRVTADVGRFRFALADRLSAAGRRHPLHSVEEVHRALLAGPSVQTPGALVDTITDRFCDEVARVASSLTQQLDEIEDSIVAGQVEEERVKLIPLRRTAVRLHRQMSSLTAVFRDWSQREDEDATLSRLSAERLSR